MRGKTYWLLNWTFGSMIALYSLLIRNARMLVIVSTTSVRGWMRKLSLLRLSSMNNKGNSKRNWRTTDIISISFSVKSRSCIRRWQTKTKRVKVKVHLAAQVVLLMTSDLFVLWRKHLQA